MNQKTQIPFSAMNLPIEMERAIEQMGFETPTDIQAQSIPLIRAGYDVIGRSQTGTGKTVAFGIPALEAIETDMENKNKVQILILCPTRELAVQACEEIKKLSAFMYGIKAVDVYGGAPMDRQIIKLKKANIVIGTPGRIMDHMRRKTLRLDHVKMVVLDEADEMLSMGFREDIETILQETPEERQTILFSATMPPAIMQLTKKYQHDPQVVQINRDQVTVSAIEQYFYDVPMGRKMDALNLVLRYHNPQRCIIFCNTKKMVDDISEYLNKSGFSAEGLHGDMKQSQRTKVMEAFKQGRTSMLIATDVAARGIDVSDIDYVINYDLPQNTEYYVHRIGRTGRAGKTGKAITICSGRRQVGDLFQIGKEAKSNIIRQQIPNAKDITSRTYSRNREDVEKLLAEKSEFPYLEMVESIVSNGWSAEQIAAAVLELHFGDINETEEIMDIVPAPARYDRNENRGKSGKGGRYGKIVINIGRDNHIAPNHLVGAIAERTHLSGSDIGKIEIFDDKSLIAIPESEISEVVKEMKDCKICGFPTVTTAQSGNKPKLAGKVNHYDDREHSRKDYRNLKGKRGNYNTRRYQ